ncbi:MAG: putative iron-regulated protein, partial [Lentisphaeria bacterium]
MKREESQSCYTPVYAALLGCFLLLCLSSCDKLGLEPKATNTPTNIDTLSDVEINQASEKLFAAGAQAIEETILSAKTLNEHVLAFLDQPQQGSLETAQESWLAVALAYQKFAYARQFGLLQPDIFAQLNKLDYHIGSYPIQPGFIDAFGPYKYSGLVFDAGLPITRESLAHQQGLTDIEEVVLGIYAIDFMLYNVDGRRRSEDYSASNTLTKAQR